VLADEVETGIGPVFLLDDLKVRWTNRDMGFSFPERSPGDGNHRGSSTKKSAPKGASGDSCLSRLVGSEVHQIGVFPVVITRKLRVSDQEVKYESEDYFGPFPEVKKRPVS